MTVPQVPRPPSLAEGLRFWAWLGCVNFGGPAGQIALMNEELVERRRWIGHDRFQHALNYCMLLPGPEAMQLATYVGWLLHGTLGGVAAGILFILPGVALMLALSIVYSLHGEVGWIAGIFHGLGPAVCAIVAVAVVRIARRSLCHPASVTLAAAAFVSIFFLSVPFPAVVLGAALIGLAGARWRPGWFTPLANHAPNAAGQEAAVCDHTPQAGSGKPSGRRAALVLGIHLALWGGPIAALAVWRGTQDLFVSIALFFSAAAMVTFGGAYAVLAYVAQAAVSRYGWLAAPDMTVGLGLAESTPGPLILTAQFVGYMAGYHHPPSGWSPVLSGTLGALVTIWVTFVPCFLWILLGAPYIERLRGRRGIDSALSAVTAAVVGVILNLAVWLALRVFFLDVHVKTWGPLVLNLPRWRTLDPFALGVAAFAGLGLARWKWGMTTVIAGSALAGFVVRILSN